MTENREAIIALGIGALAVILAIAGLVLPESTPFPETYPYGNLTDVPSTFPYGNLTNIPFNFTNNLVVWYPMNDGIGNCSDYSGYMNHGLLTGALWVDGKYGKALDFNEDTDYINILNDPSLVFTDTNFTIAFYFYPRPPIRPERTYGQIVFNFGIWKQKGWRVLFDDYGHSASVILETNQAGVNQITYSTALSLDTWHFIVLVRSGAVVTIYDNGVDITAAHGTHIDPVTNNDNFLISEISPYYLDAIIDEHRLYNRALTAEEVYALYNYIP